MRNRSVTLLALLSANDLLGEPAVCRTTLVKQAYLAETIRPLYNLWLQTFDFVRYYYGPYSEDIFERLDTLIFSGLVEVTSDDSWGKRIEARYKITDAGHTLLKKCGPEEIINLAADLIWALQSLGIEQASTICKLVYQEAEFSRIFLSHTEEGIGPETKVPLPEITRAGNETFAALSAFQELRHPVGRDSAMIEPLPTREVVRLFLLSLALSIPTRSSSLSTK